LVPRAQTAARAPNFRASALPNAPRVLRPRVAARRCHPASATVAAKSPRLHAAKDGHRKTDVESPVLAASAAEAMNSHKAVATVTARRQAVEVLVLHVVAQRAAALVTVPRHAAAAQAALAVVADTVEILAAAMAARAAGRAPADVVVTVEIRAGATVARAAADTAVTAVRVPAVAAIVAAQGRTHRVHAGAIVVIRPAVPVALVDPVAVATAAEPVPADAAAMVAARVAAVDLAAAVVAVTAATAVARVAALVDMVVALTAKPRAAADRVAGEAVMPRQANHVASRAADVRVAVAQAVVARLRVPVVVSANLSKARTHARAPTQLRMLQQRFAAGRNGRAHLHL
jgi:hypothetical protein